MELPNITTALASVRSPQQRSRNENQNTVSNQTQPNKHRDITNVSVLSRLSQSLSYEHLLDFLKSV